MPVREIRLFGDPVLKTVSDSVIKIDNKVNSLVEDLIDTTKVPGRAGVAAPQIGVNLRVFSFNVGGQVGYVINPVIKELGGQVVAVEEGCLSLPGLWHRTPRYESAKVSGINLSGEEIEISGTGLLAQALQHECDHLDGLVYIDRLEGQERKDAMKILRSSDWFRS